MVRLLARLQGAHLEVLRVGVPRFLFGGDDHMGPEGVRGVPTRRDARQKTFFTFVSGKIDLVFFVAGKPCGEGVSYSKDHKKAWLLVDGKKVQERP